MVHVCNSSTQEAEAGEVWSSGVQDQPGLHTETLSQKGIEEQAHTTYNAYIPWPDRWLLFNFGGLSTGILLKV